MQYRPGQARGRHGGDSVERGSQGGLREQGWDFTHGEDHARGGG